MVYKGGLTTISIDTSSEAIATRLKRVSQLRRLCLSLGKARLESDNESVDSNVATTENEVSDENNS